MLPIDTLTWAPSGDSRPLTSLSSHRQGKVGRRRGKERKRGGRRGRGGKERKRGGRRGRGGEGEEEGGKERKRGEQATNR